MIVAAIVAAVVVVVGMVVVLSGDDDDEGSTPGSAVPGQSGDGGVDVGGGDGGAGSAGGDIVEFAEAFVAAINEQDGATFDGMLCEDSGAFGLVDTFDGAELVDIRDVTSGQYEIELEVVYQGETIPTIAPVTDESGTFCVGDLDRAS